MSLVYFDSSALVELLVEGEGSAVAAVLWDGSDAVVASRLAYPEVRAALAAAGRAGRPDAGGVSRAEELWERFWAAVRPVELTAAVSTDAGRLAAEHGLRGADAVHLASLVAVGVGTTPVAVWDRRLRDGARSVGATVVPTDGAT